MVLFEIQTIQGNNKYTAETAIIDYCQGLCIYDVHTPRQKKEISQLSIALSTWKFIFSMNCPLSS